MFFEKDRIPANRGSSVSSGNPFLHKSSEYFGLRDRVYWILLKKDVDEKEVERLIRRSERINPKRSHRVLRRLILIYKRFQHAKKLKNKTLPADQ